ncbi:hypothetical protein DM860_010932 [Cuscuta australis]|uniref:Uncharacterized protein n=1 Tax=Cuscuta australis TaxID=267555 RepID=A0A328E1Q8_9ASTE|nr:hypothetical protein DM860_010932 [Cuscuta australis]
MDGAKVAHPSSVSTKLKKKQGKNELDRTKQAEKKKRRLEKALATSAAIRSELEKKKERKKEEQKRLDEEGAAIAEAVALHVLLGEEEEEDGDHTMQKKDAFVMGRGRRTVFGWEGSRLGDRVWVGLSSGYYCEGGGNWEMVGISPHLVAEQAIASLQIGEGTSLIGR